jgi:hypothetical protein
VVAGSPRTIQHTPHRRLGGPQGRSGRLRKISPLLGIDPQTVQPVASGCTDWAILAHINVTKKMRSRFDTVGSLEVSCQSETIPVSVGILAELLGQNIKITAKCLLLGGFKCWRENNLCSDGARAQYSVLHYGVCTISKSRESVPFRIEDDHTYAHTYIHRRLNAKNVNEQYHTVQKAAAIRKQCIIVLYIFSSLIDINKH